MMRPFPSGWLRLSLGGCALLSCLLGTRLASAYPQFVFKGYGDCSSCHHSPSGGGLPNQWGRASLSPTFESPDIDWGNQDLTYNPAEPLALKLDLGLDVRLMPLLGTDGDAAYADFIPMLTEIGGAAALGRWVLYGTGTVKEWYGTGPSLLLTSREHWIMYRADGGLDVRLGRMVLPFGIRQPDHTQYVRQDFGFDKFDQSYSLEVDARAPGLSVFGSLFAGDLTSQPRQRQDRGVAFTIEHEFAGGSALGVSALGSVSTARTRAAGSLFTRAGIGSRTYLLGELAAQNIASVKGDESFAELAEYLRLGCFATPALDVFIEGGHREYMKGEALVATRLGVGANWQLFRWFEFAPEVFGETRTGLPARLVAMGQLHLVY
jgi:hypothetical protein